jgi:hypothetical protein
MDEKKIKHAINLRFVEAIDVLKKRKLFKSRAAYARRYDIGLSSISDWLSGRSTVDLWHIHNMAINYPFINLEYIITGRGELENKGEGSSALNDSDHGSTPLNEDLKKRLTDLEELVRNIQKGEK